MNEAEYTQMKEDGVLIVLRGQAMCDHSGLAWDRGGRRLREAILVTFPRRRDHSGQIRYQRVSDTRHPAYAHTAGRPRGGYIHLSPSLSLFSVMEQ